MNGGPGRRPVEQADRAVTAELEGSQCVRSGFGDDQMTERAEGDR